MTLDWHEVIPLIYLKETASAAVSTIEQLSPPEYPSHGMLCIRFWAHGLWQCPESHLHRFCDAASAVFSAGS